MRTAPLFPLQPLLRFMHQLNNPIRIALISSLAFGLLTSLGCKPATAPDVSIDTTLETPESPDTSASTVTSDLQQPETRASSTDEVVIRGDLSSVDWQSLVGKKVAIEGDLVIVDTYDLVRRGQINVARQRLYVPTSRVDPNDVDPSANSFEGGSNVAKVTEAQKFNDTAIITLDDGPATQNIFPPLLFPNLGTTDATVRLGSVLHGVSGKMVQAGSKLLLVADQPLRWTAAERPQQPNVGGADVTVASFNVLNYFTTLDNGNNNARGADSAAELERQEAKLVSAMVALDADVIGLMEIENNLDAEKRLVAALNKAIGKDAFQGCGLPDDFRNAPGGRDAIRVGIIYRSDRVSPNGDVAMIRDDAFHIARTPISQSFQTNGGGEPFTVIVNHFKSKGGASDAKPDNKNKGDGQGAFNAGRRSQSLAICEHIDSLKSDGTEPRVLVIGDLNAYQQEDPIDVLRANGLVDLQARFEQSSETGNEKTPYSYVYYGQSGSLDHAFATEALANNVSGVATWHINADEPRSLDYNQEYNPAELFHADPYRSSDHDPVLIGIRN